MLLLDREMKKYYNIGSIFRKEVRAMLEILSPAGNFEKLRAALRFGADAVYLAGKRFGMRSAADNFTDAELADAMDFVHRAGKKAYITVNTLPHGGEYPALADFFNLLRAIRPDGLIISDLGVLSLAAERLPDIPRHISTQASIVSPAAAKAYVSLGASRLVLARELQLSEIRAIRDALPPEVELEAFVHGAMCMAYSGRCMLSNFFTGRDANRGACAQPCRWHYTVVEEKRPDDPLTLDGDENGTVLFSSRDLSAIRLLPQLVEAGVNSFKIEGRIKSAYYTAVVTNAYRMALDAYLTSPDAYHFDEAWERELDSVSHRPYDTGFFVADPKKDAKLTNRDGYIREKAFFATVEEEGELPAGVERVTSDGKLCRLRQHNKLSLFDAAELLCPHRTGVPFTVKELYDQDGAPITVAPHPGMIFFARLPVVAGAGDLLRAANEQDVKSEETV